MAIEDQQDPDRAEVSVTVLGPEHDAAATWLGHETFGLPADGSVTPHPAPPGATRYGVLAEDGRLRAKLTERDFDSWFGGAEVPTSGIAGVAVAMEERGAGLVRPLMSAALDAARERGAAVATLFATAPGIYRGLGFEIVGGLDFVDLPAVDLAAVPPSTGIALRRVAAADLPLVDSVYSDWARRQHGPLTRRGASYVARPEDRLKDHTGSTLALDAGGRPVGFASWTRGHGYGPEEVLAVDDLISVDPAATAALLRALGSWAPVSGRIRLRTSGGPTGDPVRLLLRSAAWTQVEQRPYLLRVVDVARALASRPAPDDLDLELRVQLEDPFRAAESGSWRVRAGDGRVTAERTGEAADVRLHIRGLALLWAGAHDTAALRLAGLLEGPTTDDAAWDRLLPRRTVHVRDYF